MKRQKQQLQKIIFEQQEKFATRYIIREHKLYPVDFEFINIDFINKFSIIKLTGTIDNKIVIKKQLFKNYLSMKY